MAAFRLRKKEIIDMNQMMETKKIVDEKKKKEIEEVSVDLSSLNKQEEIIEETQTSNEVQEENKEGEIKEIDFLDVIKKLNDAKQQMPAIMHEYYISKIFSRVALSEKEFKMQVQELDKQIEKITNDIKDIERNIDFYKKVNNKIIEEENRINNRVDKLLLNEKMIMQRFLDINNLYYTHLKITTVNVCINKSNDKLEEFFKLIDEIISKYKNLSDAAYDLYYSSGDFLVTFVKEMVEDFKYTNNIDYINKYTYHFFLNTDAVITLDINEWIDLYNKIKFAYKSLSNIEIDAYLRLKEKYNYFEAIYTILMMQSEMSERKTK